MHFRADHRSPSTCARGIRDAYHIRNDMTATRLLSFGREAQAAPSCGETIYVSFGLREGEVSSSLV